MTSRSIAAVCHRQLPGGLPDPDGGDAKAGSVRALPAAGLSNVILARRARQKPDALYGWIIRRKLADGPRQ